jgi:V/A-type H+-transporting ATPase subunit I
MLRPEQMSKVSVTGSKRVMREVIESIHGLNLLHVTDYDGSWQAFQPGDPVSGAESASEKLVTVRAILNTLDIESDRADSPSHERILSDEEIASRLSDVREQVNDLDDEHDELRSELRAVSEQIEAMEPFATLGIELDLLSGYDSLDVTVGEGKVDAVEATLADVEEIDAFDTFAADGVVAVFAYPVADADPDVLDDALVGVEFSALEIPDAEGSPEQYVRELDARREELRADLDDVQTRLDEVRDAEAEFLLAAEEKLAIDVQKTEAPLSFATTDNAFVAEGWIPTERWSDFESTLTDAVGDHVEIEELERARFDGQGGVDVQQIPSQGAGGPESPTAADGGDADAGESARADGGDTARADGGSVVMRRDTPPVVQDNPGLVKPFEILVQAVSRPKYTEFDPTIVLFLTFPAFFGFMIGDVGYGVLYTAIGYFLYSRFESPGFKSMGGITIFAGAFTILFGILYGEVFGLHTITELLWQGTLGLEHAPIEKGLDAREWALAWLVVSVAVGIFHLNVGFVFDFVENLELHDLKHAVYESGSWILMLNGLWVWVFSRHLGGTEDAAKPMFLYEVFAGEPFGFGFAGFPVVVGFLGLAVFFLGLFLLIAGEPIEAVEFLNVLVNGLSYTRIAAVLLAKAGMAFTVNLLFFGAYEHDGFHFMINYGPAHVVEEYGREAIMFPGLMHSGIAGVLGGILVLLLGHALVLALGITSAGLQAIRLEYVEFFGKFFEGGGRQYSPFGYQRRYTRDEASPTED